MLAPALFNVQTDKRDLKQSFAAGSIGKLLCLFLDFLNLPFKHYNNQFCFMQAGEVTWNKKKKA